MVEKIELDTTRLLQPIVPGDAVTFDELKANYNFRNISDHRRIFCNLIANDLKKRKSPVLLDIGCGCGMARDTQWQWALKPFASTYWGIEPDPKIVPVAGLFDRVCHTTVENADLPDNSVDLAYSWMVMEHVETPIAFCERLYRMLKPGGVYYFSTPNSRHYFTRLAKSMKSLRMDEWVLSMIRKPEELEEYHYPVQYRFNSESAVASVAQQAGFKKPEFAYVEVEGPISYFPGPTKIVFHVLAWKRSTFRRPNNLLIMMGRLEKPLA